MAQHQKDTRYQETDTTYNPLEEGVYARLESLFTNIREDARLYAFPIPYDDNTNLETPYIEGIAEVNRNLRVFTTFGSGGTELEGRVIHHDSETDSKKEYRIGLEYWTLTKSFDENDDDGRVPHLLGLADHAARGYVTKKPTMPGTVHVSGFQNGPYKYSMTIPFDPATGIELAPVVADGTAVHFLYVVPLKEEEAEELKSRQGAGDELINFLKELGEESYDLDRPSAFPKGISSTVTEEAKETDTVPDTDEVETPTVEAEPHDDDDDDDSKN